MTSDCCSESPELPMAPEGMAAKKADSVIIGDDSDRERKDDAAGTPLNTARRSLPANDRPRSREGSQQVPPRQKPQRTVSSSSRAKRSPFPKTTMSAHDMPPPAAERSRPSVASYASSTASSRRASSIYDGSRRPRHTRSQMSVMTPNQIEQALELHQRSCSIFRTNASPAPSPTISRSPSLQSQSQPRPPSMLKRSATDSVADARFQPQRVAPVPYQPVLHAPQPVLDQAMEESEEALKADYLPATIIHWTSPSTRRREYEELDRQSRGLRRLWRKVKPKCWGDSAMVQLYDGTNGADNGSIRRYRIDDEDDAGQREAQPSYDERDKKTSRTWIARLRR